jgi:hypothetical protein
MKKVISIFLTLILGAATLFAQTPTGSLTGVVSGPDGVLPNATVEIKFNNTGKTQTVTTGDDGSFTVVQLEPGTYTVTVSSQGFKTFVANEVKIDIGREYNIAPTLEIGSVQESVTVTAGADVITSTTGQITTVVNPQQILSLPLVTRNPLDLTTLQAGVTTSNFQNTVINGMRTSGTNITRDGISINDPFIRSNATDFAAGRPSVDDTGEFTITTGVQESDVGGGGAQIQLVTPRGTSEFHGGLFAYNRNSAFAANNFFNNRSGIVRPFRNRNQYGGKIGGPFPVPNFGEDEPVFYRDKGFFFFAYEGIKDPVTARYTRTILTPSARSGAFNFTRAAAGNPISNGALSCPSGAAGSTCTISNILQFAQQQGFQNIPSGINSVVQNQILSLIPTAGNFTGLGDGLNTTGFSLNRAFNTTRDTYTFRGDVDITQKDSVKLVYSWNREDVLRPDVDDTGFTASPDVTQFAENEQVTLAYRRIISSTFVNEFRYGRFKNEVPFDRISDSPGFYIGAGPVTTTAGQGLLAGIITNPTNVFQDQGRFNRVTTFADDATWVLGNHTLRFGGVYQKYEVNSYNDFGIIQYYNLGNTSVDAATNTTFTAANFANAGGTGSIISTTQLGTANGLLALLGGLVNSSAQAFNLENIGSGYQPGVRQLAPFLNYNNSLYITDRWQAARGLTLNFGVRYELYPGLKLTNGLALEPVITDLDNPEAALLNRNGTYNVIGTNAGSEFRFYKTDYDNFAPSVSLAYSPNFEKGIGSLLFGREGRTVIRAGYSHNYVNDQLITSLNNTITSAGTGNVGLGRQTINAIGPAGNTALNLRLGDTVTIPTPVFSGTSRTYLQNNTANQGFFGNVGGIDPNLQVPYIRQYSLGIQRELPFGLVAEARYVGTSSTNLLRSSNLNQIDVISNGYLADFQRAQANLALTGTTPFCNPTTVAGCQSLTIFRTGSGATQIGNGPLLVGTTVTLNNFINDLRNGSVADNAQRFIAANLNNHPTVASPNLTPFVNFYPNPASGNITLLSNDAFYNYNSAQFELRRRFAQGLYLQANYTFSKNLVNGQGTAQALNEPYLQNQNQQLDYQRADYDQTHTFNFNGIYEFPFGKGKSYFNDNGILNYLVGGWTFSGIFQARSGVPISIVDTRGTLNRAAFSGRQTANSTLSVDQIRDLTGIFEANGRIYWIDPSIINSLGQASPGFIGTSSPNTAFNGQVFFNVPPGQTGNLPRAFIDGPGFWNVNMSLLKNFNFTETLRVQLRAEAFNVFNNVNFLNNTQFANINATTFGQITQTANTARELQFAFRFEF